MSAQPYPKMTPEEYREFERNSDQKHEYLDGEIYMMAGATPNHNLISSSVNFALYSQLRGKGCFLYSSDMRVKVEKTGLYTYPDMTIVCGKPEYEDTKPQTLLNPIMIIEILSPSTEKDDRGKKFQHYRNLQSLQEYVLISQNSYRIEKFAKRTNIEWLFSDTSDIDSVIELPSIDCTLRLSEVYAQVTLETRT